MSTNATYTLTQADLDNLLDAAHDDIENEEQRKNSPLHEIAAPVDIAELQEFANDFFKAFTDYGYSDSDTPQFAAYLSLQGYTLDDLLHPSTNADHLNQLIEEFGDAYQGSYSSDAEFAQTFADELGIEIGTSWPHSCIDWNHAAKELMHDYSEEQGYYFRNV